MDGNVHGEILNISGQQISNRDWRLAVLGKAPVVNGRRKAGGGRWESVFLSKGQIEVMCLLPQKGWLS